jgi:hypothetical protein
MIRIIILFIFILSNLALALRPPLPDELHNEGPSFIDDIPPWLLIIIFIAVPTFFWWIKKEDGKEFDMQGCGCMFTIVVTITGFIFMNLKGCS